MIGFRLLRNVLAMLAVMAVVFQGTLVLAGTTGSLSGVLVDASSKAPVAGAVVNAVSPSQAATAKTDAAGRFTFLALSPDTYVLSVEKTGYNTLTQAGVTVVADQGVDLSLAAQPAVKTIGRVSSRSASDLVRPGTTADVYSVSAEQQADINTLGGGGTQNSAWSGVASVPGVYVAPGVSGYVGAGATVSIRGGDYNQIGYELDGVPVNRSFDNYPSGTLSSIGQSEVQVYTGAPPATAESSGLSGYINQVIKVGTYPGFQNLTLGDGGPAFYHSATYENGGATKNRNLSYYVALGVTQQDFRYFDNFNGASLKTQYGLPLGECTGPGDNTPGCVINGVPVAAGYGTENGSPALGAVAATNESNAVVNVHLALPQKNGLKDDVQFLYQNTYLNSQTYSSQNDLGGAAFLLNAPGIGYLPSLSYLTGYSWSGPVGTTLNTLTAAQYVSPYYFPSSGGKGATLAPNQRDGFDNNQAILKLQYTHSFSDTALLKVYGYTYYSNWLENAPASTSAPGVCCGLSPDYELSSHTRGVSGTFTDQLDSHTLALQASYTTATTVRDNNTQSLYNGVFASTLPIAYRVNSASPINGICYSSAGAAISCASSSAYKSIGSISSSGLADPSGTTCGTAACTWLIADNGQHATYNTVTPKFSALSLTDTWKPTSKLTLNYGLRLDSYQFDGADTTGTPGRTFFFNAFNLDNCVNAQGQLVATTTPGSCPAGDTLANLQNVSAPSYTYNILQPRVAGTFQIAPTTVLRASYGRYGQAPNAAFEQYNSLQQNLPSVLASFYNFGFTTPGHEIQPEVSNNFDFSLEHRFAGTDLSVKLTPFLRKTQNQIQDFFLDQATSFVSGLNVGRQTSQGFEFEVDKGDFSKNGFAGKLAFTYTNSYIEYSKLSNGSTVVTGINTDIANYNAYTQYCFQNPTSNKCGSTSTLVAAAPYYDAVTGAACYSSCTGGNGYTANPYWSSPAQNLIDTNQKFATYDIVPGGPESSVDAYGVPYVVAASLNYKHNRFAMTPTIQFIAGQRYGAPETTIGSDPACGSSLSSCGGTLNAIPDQLTGAFDGIGAFVQPSNLLVNLQTRYDLTDDVKLIANFTNIVNSCFGGTKWAGAYVANACGYGINGAANAGLALGVPSLVPNNFSAAQIPAGQTAQLLTKYPYGPFFRTLPFGMYLSAKIKI